MQMNIFKNRSFNLVLVGIILVLAACKKTELSGPDRLFRPVTNGLLSEGNWVRANWTPIKDAKNYTVWISKDTFRTIIEEKLVDTSSALFENLLWNQLYQVRVRANAADTSKNSKISELGGIKTPKFPSILNPITLSDVTDEAVRVSWTTSGDAVTGIRILKASDSSLVQNVTLTAADVTNQYRIVSGLQSGTPYIVYLYSGNKVRGWENFTTKSPIAGALVDLRGITGRPSVLTDTLPVVPNGAIILLKRGETYTIGSTTSLSKSVKIVSGSDLANPTQAMISMPSNFNVAAGSNIDFIDFEDVYLKGTDYTSKYVFNISNPCNIGRISFESCRAEIFRGVCRLQTAIINLRNFSVNNSIMDSVSNYGIINVDNVNCRADSINLTRSTFYKVEKVVTSRTNSTYVNINECTFNETPLHNSTGSYIVDYNALNVTGGLNIKNCIFGIGKNNLGSTVGVRMVRYGTTTPTDFANNYRTSDQNVNSNQIPNIITYPGTIFDLWEDPLNGNFRFRSTAVFAGKSSAGDPRWR